MDQMCTESVEIDCSRVVSKRRRGSIHMRDKPSRGGCFMDDRAPHSEVVSWVK